MQTRSSVSKTPQSTPLRRSSRLLNQKNPTKSQDLVTPKAKSNQNRAFSPAKISEKPKQTLSCVPKNSVNSASGLRRSPRLSGGSLSNKPEVNKFVERKKVERRENKRRDKGILLDKEKREVERKKNEVEGKQREVCVGLKAVAVESRVTEGRELCERNEDAGVKRKIKRKRGEGGDENVQGWTRGQELALQRAYFSAKPTPNFWKKVSKLVPGKSAQDCFDKIHSDHLTPTQPQPRSRAKSINISPIEHISLSASKVLKPTATAWSKRSGCRKQKKSHRAQRKTVRHLLQKNYHLYQGEEADLFSILEPNTSPSMHALPPVVLSTPKTSLEKQGFLQKCHERSSSVPKKHRFKLDNSCRVDLVSPPVLKQIKNRVLHEKYIDQLHSREAKRKAEERKVLGKENRGSIQSQKIDEVRAAKNALVSDARFVINQLQHLQCVDNSFDLDNDDDLGSGDDDKEIQL